MSLPNLKRFTRRAQKYVLKWSGFQHLASFYNTSFTSIARVKSWRYENGNPYQGMTVAGWTKVAIKISILLFMSHLVRNLFGKWTVLCEYEVLVLAICRVRSVRWISQQGVYVVDMHVSFRLNQKPWNVYFCYRQAVLFSLLTLASYNFQMAKVHSSRNRDLAPGISRYSRSAIYRKRALYKRKKTGVKKVEKQEPSTRIKEIGGDKNGQKRIVPVKREVSKTGFYTPNNVNPEEGVQAIGRDLTTWTILSVRHLIGSCSPRAGTFVFHFVCCGTFLPLSLGGSY